MDHILAVDGGGTKCEALLMTTEGEALAFHAVYPETLSVTADYGRGRNGASALDAIRTVTKTANPGGLLHLVGGSGSLLHQFRRELKADRVMCWYAPEEESVRAWAGVEEALVALSGTGAFGHLYWRGRHGHADGLGPLLGDWGSGYHIGREGLRAAFRAYLHPGRGTVLRDVVAREVGKEPDDPGMPTGAIPEGIRIFADRTAVARYAGMVDRAARAGDPEAVAILESAAADLAMTLRGLVEKAGAGNEALPFLGSGGVIQNSDRFWNALCGRVADFLPRGRPLRQTLPQAAGLALAGLLQARSAGVLTADPDRIRARLNETLPPLRAAGKKKEPA